METETALKLVVQGVPGKAMRQPVALVSGSFPACNVIYLIQPVP